MNYFPLKPAVRRKVQIEAPSFGRTFDLDLFPTPNLVSDEFMVLEVYPNRSVPFKFMDEDLRCYFQGSNAAVSLCKGVVSIIK